MVRSLYEISECKDCASQNIIHNEKSMQIICKDCGLIYDPFKPVKEVAITMAASKPSSERIIRPAPKKVIQRKPVKAKPIKKAPVKKAKKLVRPAKPVKLQKKPKGLGAKMKGLMRKLIKRR